MSTLLQHLDDLVLVLRKDFGEAVGALGEIVLCRARETAVDQTLRVVHLGAQGQHLARLLGNGDGVTRQHLHLQTQRLGLGDSARRILARRVEHGHHAQQLPVLVAFLDSNTERTETAACKVISLLGEQFALFLGAARQVEHRLGRTLGTRVGDAALLHLGNDTLRDRVERRELLGGPALLENVTRLRIPLKCEDGNLVNGVQRLDVVRRGESGNGHHPRLIDALHAVRFTDGKLVGRQCTGLVRAEDVDASQRLDGRELLHDGLFLGEIGSADGESGGGDDGQTDRHTNNEEDENVVKQVDRRVFRSRNLKATEETTNPGSDDPADDENQQRGTDIVHDGLEMALVLGALDETGGAADKRAMSDLRADGVRLATLAARGVEESVAHVFIDGERLTRDSRLVSSNNREAVVFLFWILVVARFLVVLLSVVGILVFEALPLLEALLLIVITDEGRIAWNDLAFFNNDDITRDDFTSENVVFGATANDSGFHGDVTLERSHHVGSLLLLVPTDNSVEHEDTNDDTEINPLKSN